MQLINRERVEHQRMLGRGLLGAREEAPSLLALPGSLCSLSLLDQSFDQCFNVG